MIGLASIVAEYGLKYSTMDGDEKQARRLEDKGGLEVANTLIIANCLER
jgi:hypothetical protein